MGIFDNLWGTNQQQVGNLVDSLGGLLGIKETGASEWINGGNPTVNSANPVNVWANNTVPNNIQQQASDSIDYGIRESQNYAPGWTNGQTPAPTQTTTNNNNNTNGGIPGVDMSFYQGWTDQNAINADWNNTWQQKLGQGGSGSNPSGDALSGMKSAYNSAYDQVFSALDQYAGLIPQYQQQREQSVNNLYGTQQNEINTAMQGSLGSLDTSKQNVAANQAKSVRDLQENMRNMLQAGNIQLGIGGAGDSSAANMYAYALSKQAGRNSADISNQASSQYSQIDAQAKQIRATADDNLAKLGTWKADNLNNVLSWAQDQMGNIQSQKINATGQKAQALAAAEAGIIQNALSSLQNIDTQIATWRQGIQSWAANRMATLDDAKLKMANSGQYNSADIVAKELQGMNGTTSAATSSANMAGYNPFASQKKDYTDFLSGYSK